MRPASRLFAGLLSLALAHSAWAAAGEAATPRTALSEYSESTEAGRLLRIWLAYRSHHAFVQEFAKRCEALGVDTAAAHAAHRKFNAEADAKFGKLEERLRIAIAANGADPDRELGDLGLRLDTDIKLRTAEMFLKPGGADEQRSQCGDFVVYLGSIEGSFRFNEYYERLLAL